MYGLERVEEARTVAEKARRYAEAVAAAHPDGPCLLGGWSFGGFVAQETARQLTAAGRDVRLVVLLDSVRPLPRPGARRPSGSAPHFTGFARHVADTYGVDWPCRTTSWSATDDDGERIDTRAAGPAGGGRRAAGRPGAPAGLLPGPADRRGPPAGPPRRAGGAVPGHRARPAHRARPGVRAGRRGARLGRGVPAPDRRPGRGSPSVAARPAARRRDRRPSAASSSPAETRRTRSEESRHARPHRPYRPHRPHDRSPDRPGAPSPEDGRHGGRPPPLLRRRATGTAGRQPTPPPPARRRRAPGSGPAPSTSPPLRRAGPQRAGPADPALRFDARPGRTYPVLYLLHGAHDDYTSWTRETDIEAFTEGRDLIVAMPDAGPTGIPTAWRSGPGLRDVPGRRGPGAARPRLPGLRRPGRRRGLHRRLRGDGARGTAPADGSRRRPRTAASSTPRRPGCRP